VRVLIGEGAGKERKELVGSGSGWLGWGAGGAPINSQPLLVWVEGPQIDGRAARDGRRWATRSDAGLLCGRACPPVHTGAVAAASASASASDTDRGRRWGLSHARRARSVPAPTEGVETRRKASRSVSARDLLRFPVQHRPTRRRSARLEREYAFGYQEARCFGSAGRCNEKKEIAMAALMNRRLSARGPRRRYPAPHRLHDPRPVPLRHSALGGAPGHAMADAHDRALCRFDLDDGARVATSETASPSLNPRPIPQG
jgi:hypothetical protein